MAAAAGQVQWDRIITAAASSTLGIVSLALLVLAGLAVLLFRGSAERTRLTVFAAVLGLALVCMAIAVLRERSDAPMETAAVPVDAPSLTVAEPGAAPAATDAAAAAPDLNGDWADDEGFTYRFRIRDGRLTYTQQNGGVTVGGGEGTVDGRRLDYAWRAEGIGNTGTCTALASADGQVIEGNCGSDGDDARWPFRIRRVAG